MPESILQVQGRLFLLVTAPDFSYQIRFEFEDLNRWRISKLHGGTGVPEGID